MEQGIYLYSSISLRMSLKNFQILSKLGEGAYSSVYIVKRLADSEQYALKKVKIGSLSEKEQENALTEVRILASMKNPHIVGFKEAFYESNYLCIVMEYMDNGDLFQKIEEHTKKGTFFPEQTIWNVLIQVRLELTKIVKGLNALHKLNILHRDLKSANVFLNKDGTAKLGDMNVSKVTKKGLCETQTGTPYYASPEVWNDQPYDSKSDIWSLGCVLYEMTMLKPPFKAEDMEGLYKKIMRGAYPRISSRYSPELASVIRSLLMTNPKLRPNCENILRMSCVRQRNPTKDQSELCNSDLLKTIKLPRVMKRLSSSMLPAATYTLSVQKSLQNQSQIKPLNISFPGISSKNSPRGPYSKRQNKEQRKKSRHENNKPSNVKELISHAQKARKEKYGKDSVVGLNIQGQGGRNQKEFLPRIHATHQRKLVELREIYLQKS